MPGVMLICGLAQTFIHKSGYDLVGVDRGALICAQQGSRMKAAIGDFDSVNAEEFALIQQFAETIEQLPSHKNETDTEAAIQYVMKQGYDDLLLYGALGGRLDHELANLFLLIHRQYPITLINEKNRIRMLTPGDYQIAKEYTYLSFLPLEDACISETGVAYPLTERKLGVQDIYAISNEIIEPYAHITVHYGRLLMIEAEDEHNKFL